MGLDGETTATAVETPTWEVGHTGAPAPTPAGDLLGVPDLATIETTMTATPPTATAKRKGRKWDMVGTGDAEIYMFSCVTVVIWSMTEKRFL